MISTKAPSNLLFAWRSPRKQKNHRQACVLMTTLITGLMLMNHEAVAQEPSTTKASGLTCNINGIPPHERARYGHLVEALRHAIQKRRELPDGYAFQERTPRRQRVHSRRIRDEVRTLLDGSGLLDRQHDRIIVSTPFHSLFRRFEKLSRSAES
jgi:hypothetical protein